MGWSRSARIKTLLAIDTVFLFIELITGYAVGSLALVADSFHMLNDVMSLIVALYALKLAENSTRSNKYSYGWQRAEILGALINGVFLLALCFSIFLEAIQRMFEGPEVSNPQVVVIVGSLGLLSNIIGLFLFHEHGHGHGGHSHGHSHSHDAKAEEGHANAVTTFSAVNKKKGKNGDAGPNGSATSVNGDATERTPLLGNAPKTADFPALPSQQQQHQQQSQASQNVAIVGGADTPMSDTTLEDESDALEDLLMHPARTREAIVRQAYDAGFGSPRNSTGGDGFTHRRTSSFQGSMSTIKRGRNRTESASHKNRERSASRGSGHDHDANAEHDHDHEHEEDDEHLHEHESEDGHDHDHEEDDHGHGHGGHSHANMNMQGVFLHVLGDALGNVGVIAAGLIIWLTKSPYRFYSDPIISFVITIIIFSSALPLVRSASFILLQGTPAHVPLEKVRSAILKIPNVISVHDLHIWSLSESKLVASMHILVKSHDEFAACSQSVRKVLHRFGVHSTTIQPELLDMADPTTQTAIMSRQGSRERLMIVGDDEDDDGVGCMAQCVEDSCVDSSCCPPNSLAAAALPGKSAPSTLATKSNGSLRPSGPGGPSYATVASSH